MKHLTLIICLSILFTSSNGDSSNHVNNKNHSIASSILTIKNITSSTTITAVTFTFTVPYHIPSPVTISTNITPGDSQEFNLGGTDEYMFVTLHLSNSISGDIQVNEFDPYYCPWLICSVFSSDSNPNVYFYMYTPRWLYLSDYSQCFC